MRDNSGLTTEEKIQQEIGGSNRQLIFKMQGESKAFHEAVFQEGVTFEWVKNKIAEKMFARYEDLSLFMNEKRIPEPFCLVDMQVQSGQVIDVQVREGAVYGEAVMRQQVLQ